MKKDYLTEKLLQAGFKLSDEQLSKLQEFALLLAEHNKNLNLTAITEDEEIINKHFIDSLQAASHIEKSQKIVDIGSGAGFPSIPLKIMYPQKRFLLLDALRKRINFLNIAINQLNLENIEATHIRIEEAGRQEEYRAKHDVVLARAVAELNTLIEYSAPLLKTGGKLIAYKGEKAGEEIENAKNALKELKCQISEVKEYKIDGLKARYLVIIEKMGFTPEIYPRSGNKPRKKPL